MPMDKFFSHVFRVSSADNDWHKGLGLATALFVRQATEPTCVQSLCHLKLS